MFYSISVSDFIFEFLFVATKGAESNVYLTYIYRISIVYLSYIYRV